MKTEQSQTQTLEEITPLKAEFYLSLSKGNGVRQRQLIKNHVAHLLNIIKRGEWQITPDGIGFHQDGWLANGHHRLSAILRSGQTVYMWVTRGMTDAEIRALDSGKRRTLADLTGVPRRTVEVLTLAYKAIKIDNISPTPDLVMQALPLPFAQVANELNVFCNTAAKVLSSVPVRMAVILTSLVGNKEYAFQTYRDLVLHNYDDLPPVAKLFIKNVSRGVISSKDQLQIFAIAMTVMDPQKQSYLKLYASKDVPLNTLRSNKHLIFSGI
jgi:hypothetical protein